MSNPTSNFNWQMPTATDLVTDLPADFEVFGQAVDTTLADLKGGTTGQILSKATNTDMDFVWTSPNPGDITAVTAGTGISGGGTSGDVTITNSMATAITTSGDLIQGTGSGTFARLASGTSGQYLTTNGTTLSWGTISSGGMTLISTTAMTGASLTLTSIPTTYKELQLIILGASMTGNAQVDCIYNNDSGANYTYSLIRNAGTNVNGQSATGANATIFCQGGTIARTNVMLALPRYTDTSGTQFHYCQSQGYNSSTGEQAFSAVGSYTKSAAITQIKLSPQGQTWSSGTAYLYGVS